MPRELKLYLWDIRGAAHDILEYTRDKSFDDYRGNSLLRAAVERKFEIIGEAFAQSRELYPEMREHFDSHNQIVAFRNRVIHGYFSVNDALVWSIVKVYLPSLLDQVETALRSVAT